MQQFKVLLACMAATMLFSCSRKDENKTPPVTPSTDKLLGSWITTAIKADRPVYHWNTTELVTDLWDREKDCIKDNLLIFKTDGNYVSDEGASKCSASDPKIIGNGTWKKSGATLAASGNGADYTYAIDKLDDSSLVLTGQRFYILGSDTTFYNATTTYKRQ